MDPSIVDELTFNSFEDETRNIFKTLYELRDYLSIPLRMKPAVDERNATGAPLTFNSFEDETRSG